MSKSNQSVISFLILLVSASLITEKAVVFGTSTVAETIAKRPDPLRNFKTYGGDYDIRNKHYWASAAFTGIHGYTVGGLWLLSGIGFGSYLTLKNLYGRTSTVSDQPNSSSYIIVVFLIVLFTVFVIIAGSVTIAENEKTMQRTKKLEETIIRAGDHTCQTMGNVRTSLIKMQTDVQQYDSSSYKSLDSMASLLRKESLIIQSYMDKFRHSFNRALQTIYIVTLVVLSINFALLLAGLVLLTAHNRPAVIVLIFSCWILTTLSWIMTGIDYFLHTFIKDTCSNLKNFNENYDNNTMTEMLPCPKFNDTQKHLSQIGLTVHSFITEMNTKISELCQVLKINEQGEGLPMIEICDPFGIAPNYSYSPGNCGNNSLQVGDLPKVVSEFICYQANSKNCTSNGKFLPEAIYTPAAAYCESVQELINVYPDMSSLMECSSIKDAISDIATRQCKPTKVSTNALWSSMLSFSLAMAVYVLLWSLKAIHDRRVSFT